MAWLTSRSFSHLQRTQQETQHPDPVSCRSGLAHWPPNAELPRGHLAVPRGRGLRVGGTHGVPSPWCSSARAARPSPSAVPRPRSILYTWGRGPRDGGQERVQLRPCPWCACPHVSTTSIQMHFLPASHPHPPFFLTAGSSDSGVGIYPK